MMKCLLLFILLLFTIHLTIIEIANALKKVPYVVEARQVPCVWYISSFLSTSLRTLHDFGNVHHVWFHKNIEGNYKFRISKKIYFRSLYFILMKLFWNQGILLSYSFSSSIITILWQSDTCCSSFLLSNYPLLVWFIIFKKCEIICYESWFLYWYI